MEYQDPGFYLKNMDAPILVLVAIIILLIIWILYTCAKLEARTLKQYRKKKSKARTAVVLGSGGHTTEMLKLLSNMDRDIFSPRIYYVANTDKFSIDKLEEFEKGRADFQVYEVPRAREVGQSCLSSVFSTIKALCACIGPVNRHQVDLLLVNGPGTCLPVCFLHLISHWWLQIIYIESICRVKTLSLSCQIIRRFASVTLVQWPELAEKYKGTTYIGRIL